ncbi:4-hydroxythreonine-4-phosphate dehydrogenase PdxA [Bordetella sp. 02P26C-1]|uniref:4-hydroxythreonine-4-phosphate dehydrogenase PdxA n=1 Tax=Bordetella sp. 02P26C-1 TaxID=2683195 RepID=UPI0013523E4D|nr:4-hydroxythreonine-4-phosphate dehydrogenase PdxA [Bordetella sp. 02P26C-1]MVW77606.1 4-hydroxythreonine-4-phosphate dehydrogenase [Bordetella sp. 02P26C-1]
MKTQRPRLAVLLGDPAGVGPEMAVKLLAREQNRHAADLLVITDPVMLADAQRLVGVTLDTLTIESLDDVRYEPGRLTVLAQNWLDGKSPPMGECTVQAGHASFQALETALEAVKRGLCDGIVFAPLNKHSLRLGGLQEEDELRHIQQRLQIPGFVCEFNITGKLWTSRVTSHVPIREVADLITQETICDAVKIIDTALRQAGIEQPRIAVSGLNPHAGDGGSIGMEEIEVIAPAVERARAMGADARGPYSPDTIFIAARRGDFDAVVSMFHDQGQIAMKLIGFEHGVTLHGGLPVPVVTSASGSAFDIAGKGIANIEGLQHAFDLCVRIASSQQQQRQAA